MSANDPKQTWRDGRRMSAFGGKADITFYGIGRACLRAHTLTRARFSADGAGLQCLNQRLNVAEIA
jgi:hypothetical protein